MFMDIIRYQLVQGDDGQNTLIVYLDPQLEEFSQELGLVRKGKDRIQQQIQNLARRKYPNMKIHTARVMAGTMIVATFAMSAGGFASQAAAAEQSTQTILSDSYVVQSGDSLSVIAKRYGVTVDSLKTMNGLTSDVIYVGQILKLPYYTYTVVSGDSLSVIAKRYNSTVDQIRSYNNLTSDTIYIGQKLRIPVTQTADSTPVKEDTVVAPVQEETAPTPTETTTYTVQSGDTLFLISKRFNTTVDKLKEANRLTTDTIFIGQKLTIPTNDVNETQTPAPEPVQNDPVRNETTTGTNQEIPVTNEAVPETNQEIPVVNDTPTDTNQESPATNETGSETNQESPVTNETTPEIGPTTTYTVVAGDSLSVIAKNYGTTVDAIKQVNGLTGDMIFVGQKLQIPGNQEISPVVEEVAEAPIEEPVPEVDANAPDAPILANNEAITKTNQAEYSISGVTEANAKVQINLKDAAGASNQLELEADGTGAFSGTLDVSQLQDGKITVTVTSTDQAGNVSSETSQTVEKDTTTMTAELNTPQAITNQNVEQYTISGITEKNSTVEISIIDRDENTVSLQGTAGENGEFQVSSDLQTLTDGPITIRVQSTDAFNNTNEAEEFQVVKETVVPAPVISDLSGVSSENVTSYTIHGNARPDSKVILNISDGLHPAITAETVADINGEFHVEVDVSNLDDGNLTISASQISDLGNTSPLTEMQIGKDTQAPTAPSVVADEVINSENQTEYILNGSGERNAKVHFNFFDQNNNKFEVRTNMDEDGEFTTPVDLTSLADGEIRVEMFQIDPYGNHSPTQIKTIQKDTIGPETFILESLPGIFSGNATEYTINGTTDPFVSMKITIHDGVHEEIHTVMSDQDGHFSLTTDMNVFHDSELTLTFTGTDRAGNTTELQTAKLVKDTIVENIELADFGKFVNQDNQNQFSINGASNEEGSTIDVTISDGENELTQSGIVTNGEFQINLDVSSLKDGPLFVQLEQTDRAGNSKAVDGWTIEKDTVIEDPTIAKSGYYVNGTSTSYVLNGEAEANAKVLIRFLQDDGTELLSETTTANLSGFYTFAIPMNPTEASKIASITITQTDKAGNISNQMTSAPLSTHTVSAGESLESIAKRYNTTTAAILSLNSLSGNQIQPGQTLILPFNASEVVNLGYMYFGNTDQYKDIVTDTAGSMTTVSPNYFEINPNGSIKITAGLNKDFVDSMHSQGVRVVPFLSNHWDRELGRMMLSNKEVAAQQIADAVEKYNLDGVNVDIENVTDIDRDNFTEFVRLLREKIPSTKEVSVAVAANPNGWTKGWHGSYDYTELAKYSDYLMIMAYDESYAGGDPGSVASLDWVERSVQYAINQNVAPDKVVLGMAHFGRYWKEGSTYGGYGISNWQVEQLIEQYDGIVEFDQETMTPKATITISAGDPKAIVGGNTLGPGTYHIYFENSQSLTYKLDLVNQYNLRGVGNWSVGQQAAGVWDQYALTLPKTVPVTSKPVVEVEDPESSAPVVDVGAQTYTVVSGDSLWAIANRFDTTIAEIKSLNNLTSDNIYIGQQLRIPGQVETTVNETQPVEVEETTVTNDENDVETSDTNAGTVEEPVTDNETADGTITTDVDPETAAPTPEPIPEPIVQEDVTYIVSPGDSLSVIAKRYETTVDALKERNNLSGDTIYVGQKLFIPTEVNETAAPTEELAPPVTVTYTVKSGDSLSVIAKNYNVTVDAIKQANNLTADTIYVGQNLNIPSSNGSVQAEPTYTNYTVVSGDSLFLIAQRNNTTVSAIKTLNQLQTDNLYIGQTLKLPT